MGKLEENKRKKQKKIFDAALELFTTKGFHDTSISNITRKAGLAKGTFYLYFKDKFDVRNQLISIESSRLFRQADDALKRTDITDFEDKFVFIIDYILNLLSKDHKLMTFIAKNLGWGVFKSALTHPEAEQTLDFYSVYERMIEESPYQFHNPEVLLFMLIELVGSTCHSIILYEEPLNIEDYKFYLYKAVRDIIQGQIIRE
ncbi:MAG: TetR/AcrR family transcriptional regulator [Lachnospiraceae bacterium]|nr:TetR/AcrR family transcriptional regulator [Lachnospiraceae bacterium]